MGEETGISWCDSTWNPWVGCTKVSPGCANCYMFTGQERWGRDPSMVRRTSPSKWREPFIWNRRAIVLKRRRLVFTCSWSDFFHEAADPWRQNAWAIIRNTPFLEYQILTKRPERIVEALPFDWGIRGYPNVWLGVSVENQHFADKRLPIMLESVGAKVMFASVEPLLGPVDLTNALAGAYSRKLDWVIVGGESAGPEQRYMNQLWADRIQQQCALAHVPLWGKQRSGPVNELPLLFQGLEIKQFPQAWDPAIAVADAQPATA